MGATLAAIAGILSGGRSGLEAIPWASLRYRHTSRIRALLIEQHRAPATANRFIAALRGVLREAWRLGQMTAEDYRQAADIALVTGSRLPRGRRLAREEVEALFERCADDPTPAGARDGAILAVLLGCRSGARRLRGSRSPTTSASPARSEYESAKGRVAYALGGTAVALHDWIAVRGSSPGRLFTRVRRGGRLELGG